MNKKGFTLVELLAVIIILGILAALISPKVVKMLDDAEKKSHKTSIDGLIKSANYKYSNNDIAGITNEDIIIDYETKENIDYLDYSGDKPKKGKISIKKDGKIALAINLGDFCYIKDYDTDEIIINEYDENTCILNN